MANPIHYSVNVHLRDKKVETVVSKLDEDSYIFQIDRVTFFGTKSVLENVLHEILEELLFLKEDK